MEISPRRPGRVLLRVHDRRGRVDMRARRMPLNEGILHHERSGGVAERSGSETRRENLNLKYANRQSNC